MIALETSTVTAILLCIGNYTLAIYNRDKLLAKIPLKNKLNTFCFGNYGRE